MRLISPPLTFNLNFFPESVQTLKPFQVQKAAAVGLACILFFGVQWCCSWTLATGIALGCSAITVLSEAFLRKDDAQNTDWTNRDFDRRELLLQVALRLSVLPALVGLTTAFGALPLQAIATHILAGNKKIILLVALIAPIVEEIIFRGFVQERLEDLATLVDRHLYSLSKTVKDRFSMIAQSLLFGSVHITGGQVAKQSGKIVVFCATSFLGAIFTQAKKEDRSLLSPIALHSSQNTGVVLGLLAGCRLGKILC